MKLRDMLPIDGVPLPVDGEIMKWLLKEVGPLKEHIIEQGAISRVAPPLYYIGVAVGVCLGIAMIVKHGIPDNWPQETPGPIEEDVCPRCSHKGTWLGEANGRTGVGFECPVCSTEWTATYQLVKIEVKE